MQHIIKYNKKDRESLELVIRFNDIEFRITKQQLSHGYEQKIEYLPGIHIKVCEQKTDNLLNSGANEHTHPKHVLQKIFSLIKLIKYAIDIKIKQEVTVCLDIENKRDDIVILENDQKLYQSQKLYQDPLNEKFNMKKRQSKDRKEQFEHVATDKIMFPYHSGGWGERCMIKALFSELKLYHTRRNGYRFFEGNEMYYTISQLESLKSLCITQDPCKELLHKFRTNTYISSPKASWFDDITLNENNGVYEVENANHRVCCAKMFKIDYVKAKVYTGIKARENIAKLASYHRPVILKKPLNEQLTEEYYDVVSSVGLSKEDGRQILKQGLRGKPLVIFIQNKTQKSLIELYKEKAGEDIWRHKGSVFKN